jgi:hypothetical protein
MENRGVMDVQVTSQGDKFRIGTLNKYMDNSFVNSVAPSTERTAGTNKSMPKTAY